MSQDQVSFRVTKRERAILDRIVERAVRLAAKGGQPIRDRLSFDMDLTACHCNGNPLRLMDLLGASDADFGHDVFGIARYLDRDTGSLTNCFSPRFSAHSRKEA